MMTQLEIVTTLCELQSEGEEIKRMQTEHNQKIERLIKDIQSEQSNG